MKDFSSIAMTNNVFQTGKICEFACVSVVMGNIVESNSYAFKNPKKVSLPDSQEDKSSEIDMDSIPEFLDIYPRIAPLLHRPIIGSNSNIKSTLDRISEFYNLKMEFQYLDLSKFISAEVPGLTDYKLKTIASYFNIEHSKTINFLEEAKICASIAAKLLEMDHSRLVRSLYLLRRDYHEKLRAINVDGSLKYEGAKTLLEWLESHIEVTQEHFEIYGALRNFCSHGDISVHEEIILLRMIKIEIEKIYSML